MRVLSALIDLHSFVVLAAVVMSSVRLDHRHPWRRSFTTRQSRPSRRFEAYCLQEGLDFSPVVLLIALRFLSNLFWPLGA